MLTILEIDPISLSYLGILVMFTMELFGKEISIRCTYYMLLWWQSIVLLP